MATKKQDKAAAEALAKKEEMKIEKQINAEDANKSDSLQDVQQPDADAPADVAPNASGESSVGDGSEAESPKDPETKTEEAEPEEPKASTDDSAPDQQGSGETKNEEHDFLSFLSESTEQFVDQEKVIELFSEQINEMFKKGIAVDYAIPEIKELYEAHIENSKSEFGEWWKELLVIAHDKGENLSNRDNYKHYFENGIDASTAFKSEYPYHL